MDNKKYNKFFLIGILFLIFFVGIGYSAYPPVCGDEICDEGETETGCPQDCSEGPIFWTKPKGFLNYVEPGDKVTCEGETEDCYLNIYNPWNKSIYVKMSITPYEWVSIVYGYKQTTNEMTFLVPTGIKKSPVEMLPGVTTVQIRGAPPLTTPKGNYEFQIILTHYNNSAKMEKIVPYRVYVGKLDVINIWDWLNLPAITLLKPIGELEAITYLHILTAILIFIIIILLYVFVRWAFKRR